MKSKWVLLLAALLCWSVSGCKTISHLTDISQVTYTSETGTILPELQFYEVITITTDKVTVARNGKTEDTEINEGEWEIPVDPGLVSAFFAQLEAIDCSTIKEVEPEELEIGGGRDTYNILYDGEKSFYMMFGQGTYYTDGLLLMDPIDAFIDNLDLPPEIRYQYKPSD